MWTLKNRTTRFAQHALALGALLLISGCAVRQQADPLRASESAASNTLNLPALATLPWPSRDTSTIDARVWMRPGKQWLYIAGLDDLQGHVRPYIWSGQVEVLDRAKAGQGLICEVRRADREPEWYDPRVFAFYSSQTPVMYADRSKGPPVPAIATLDGTPMDGMLYRVRSELRTSSPEPRGIVVALRPLSGSTYIRPIINELRDRGWVVIESGIAFGIAGVGDTRDATSSADLERFGRQLGGLATERLSEWAYGVEAVLERIRLERPALAGKPIVVMGFSAGAIGAPAIAARLTDDRTSASVADSLKPANPLAALVLVGGGCDIARIASSSSLSNFGLGVTYKNQPLNASQIDELSEAYLSSSPFDAHELAPRLVATPTLMLHAQDDTIVPARTGEELYQQLGRPERWVFSGGHELLFVQLGLFKGQIADWVDAKVPQAR